MEGVLKFLKTLLLFRGVGQERDALLSSVTSQLLFRYVIQGQHIVSRGECGERFLYVLYRGKAVEECYSARRSDMVLTMEIDEGQMLAASAVPHPQKRVFATSVVAQSDCKLLGIPRALLSQLGVEEALVSTEKERVAVAYGGALEQSFRAFDKHGTGGLSKDELFKLLKSLGFNYSRKQVEVALEAIPRISGTHTDSGRTLSHPHSDRIDFHAFRDLWSRSNFLDPLNIRSLEEEEEVRREATDLAHSTQEKGKQESSREDFYTHVSRTHALREHDTDVHRIMQQKACEARSVWQEYDSTGSQVVLLDKAHVRMLLIDLQTPEYNSALVERLMSTHIERDQNGCVNFEDFMSWWMVHNVDKYKEYEKKCVSRSLSRSTSSANEASDALVRDKVLEGYQASRGNLFGQSFGANAPAATPAAAAAAVSRHHPLVELTEDEARDVFAKLFAPECERKNMSEFTMLCALMVRAMLRRPDLAKMLACTNSEGDTDREKTVSCYEAMRTNIYTRVDLECFLCYFGPKGRVAGGRTKKAGLSALLTMIS